MVKNTQRLSFKVAFDEEPSKELNPHAILFSRSGKVLQKKPLEKQQFELEVDEETFRGATLIIVPELPEHANESLFDFAKKYGYQPLIPEKITTVPMELLPIPKSIWYCWFWCICRVRGRVWNTHCGHPVPVAHARVNVCEVDTLPYLLKTIPDLDILRLKESIEKLKHTLKEKLPVIPHGPGPDPGPLMHPEALYAHTHDQEPPPLGVEPIHDIEMTKLMLDSMPQQNISNYLANSASLIRNYFVANVMWLRPLLCYFPLSWYWCKPVRTVYTDANGYFDFLYFYKCCDKPDLYFWIEYSVNGIWVPVYHPWLPCGVHWNYNCGDLINIYASDHRLPCDEYPTSAERDVHVLSIGRNINVHDINQTTGLWNNTIPMGGSLDPRVIFGDDLLTGAPAVKSYRWSYRLYNLGSPLAWNKISETVKRFYLDPADHTKTKELVLGPNTVESVFDVVGTYAPATSEPFIVPVGKDRDALGTSFLKSDILNLGKNTATASDNVYELKFELFDAAGNVIDFKAAGIKLFIPRAGDPLNYTEVNEFQNQEYLIDEITAGVHKYMGFRMIVRIDNNAVTSIVNETHVGVAYAGPCGMIEYHVGDNAIISFTATHPFNFAEYSFYIYKGSSGAIFPYNPQFGNVSAATNPYVQNVAVTSLLSGGGFTCTDAAFSENLYVQSTSNDGYDRVYGNVIDVKAFALKLV